MVNDGFIIFVYYMIWDLFMFNIYDVFFKCIIKDMFMVSYYIFLLYC